MHEMKTHDGFFFFFHIENDLKRNALITLQAVSKTFGSI